MNFNTIRDLIDIYVGKKIPKNLEKMKKQKF